MRNVRTELSARYLAALRGHLSRKTPDNGDRAQGLGRAALAGGLASRDLAQMHESAVLSLASSPILARQPKESFKRTALFFTQALIPLEAAQADLRKHHLHLQERNETLRQHTAALIRGNRRLERAVVRGQAQANAIREGQVRYRKLLLESQVMQKKLRQLTRQIISAQEEERKEISRELHDEVVQTLVGINVQLSALGHGATAGLVTLKGKIARTQRLVEKSVLAVHRFARELRPAVLDDLGLIPALQAYSENLAARKKIRISITAFAGVEALDSPKRTVLFRVAQEALTNVGRHAQATQVRLSLTQVPSGIRMEITDDGKSFHVEKALAIVGRKRLGLVGMRERMEMVGGSLGIKSVRGEGTTVRADIPFRSPFKKTKS